MATLTKEAFAEITARVQGFRTKTYAPRVHITYRCEPYVGAPDGIGEEYERIKYRYTIWADPFAQNFRELQINVNAYGSERRTFNFGRDAKFETRDFVSECLNSDVNVHWQNMVGKCTECGHWCLSQADLNEAQKANLCCGPCASEILTQLDKEFARASNAQKLERDRAFIEHQAERLKLPVEDIQDYMIARPNVARRNIEECNPLDIERFTYALNTDGDTWPEWFKKAPKLFKELVEKAEAKPDDLIKGVLPVTPFKKARQELNEKVADKTDKSLLLPASPKIMGLLQACKAGEEIVRAFETRTKGDTTGVKDTDSKRDQVYISNEARPLFNIGVWGHKHYRSCQNWSDKGGWGDDMCKTLVMLEDSNSFVVWYGSIGEMRNRALLRLLKNKNDETVLGIDRWYGSNAHYDKIVACLKLFCKERGWRLGKIYTGGHTNGDKSLSCDSFEPPEFTRQLPYTDINGWAQTNTRGKRGLAVYSYKVTLEAFLDK